MISAEFFWQMALSASQCPRPEFAVEVLDRRFGQLSFEDSYFAMFLALVDHHRHELVYCQAGAPRPVLVTADGTANTVGDGGYPVGLMAAAVFDRVTMHFSPGDRLVVCSDGVLDAVGPGGTALGENGFQELARDTASLPADRQVAEIERRLRDWAPTPDFADDVSIIVLQRGDHAEGQNA